MSFAVSTFYIKIKNQYKPNTPISLELKCTDDQAVHVCGNQTIGTTEWSSNETKEKQVKISGVTSDVSRKVQDKAGNTSICKIFVRAAKCESDCCESSDGKCTSAKCCGYEVENIK